MTIPAGESGGSAGERTVDLAIIGESLSSDAAELAEKSAKSNEASAPRPIFLSRRAVFPTDGIGKKFGIGRSFIVQK